MSLLLALLSTAFAGYSNESWDLVGTQGDGVAVVARVMSGNTTASYRILHGDTAEWCVYDQADHNTMYSLASGLELLFQLTVPLAMPSCWSELTSSEKSEVYHLYRALRGSEEADWTIEVHRVTPSLTGSSETLAQDDYEDLRAAAEQGSSAFSAQASSLLALSTGAWSGLSSANQSAIFEAFDWIDGD